MSLCAYLPGVQVSVGCTEPAAIALATALAYRAVGGEIQRVALECDSGVIKNAYNVGINGQSGVNGGLLAAALGALAGEPEARLAVLRNVSPAHIEQARLLLERNDVTMAISGDHGSQLFIDARVYTSAGCGRAVIQDQHTRVTLVEANGHLLPLPGWAEETSDDMHTPEHPSIEWSRMTLGQVWARALDQSAEDRAFLLSGAEMNLAAAEAGLRERAGLGIGASLRDLIGRGFLCDNVANRAAMLAAAGSDARMAGLPVPVMTSGYSGNQGLVATQPVLVVARANDCPEDKLAHALGISHCTVAYVKAFTGNLSPLCNAVLAASMGAASAITYLLGAPARAAERALAIIAANSAGVVCDGAKPACALRVATGARQAVEAAFMASSGVEPTEQDGIVGHTLAETLRNLGRLGHAGMAQVNREILEMILH